MSQANLLRLMSLYPDVPPGEWAEFFGWKWEAPEPSTDDVIAEREGSEGQDKISKTSTPTLRRPNDIGLWYLANLSSMDKLTPIASTASLAPDRTLPPSRVRVRYFESRSFWRAKLDRILGFYTEDDELDIGRCIDQAAKYQPVAALPVKHCRSHALGTLVLVDQSPALEPLYGWQIQLLTLIKVLTGAQAMEVITLDGAPAHAEEREALIGKSLQYHRVIVLTTLNKNYCDKQTQDAWNCLMLSLQDQGVEFIQIEPRLLALDKRVVDWIMACAVSLTYPRSEDLASICIALGGGQSELLAAWNHQALTHPGHFFQIKTSFRDHFASIYHQIPANLQAQISAVVASLRAGKPASQITMESLLCAAHGRERLPDEQWIAGLCAEAQIAKPSVTKAFFDGLSCEVAEITRHLGDRRELAPLFDLIDLTAPLRIPSEKMTHSYSVVGQQEGLLLVNGAHPNALFTADSAIMDEAGQELDIGEYPGWNNRHFRTKDLQFTLASMRMPAWADRFHRRSDGYLEAIHQEGARFELIPASLERPNSVWHLAGGLWPWAQDAGIDDHGLWAELTVKSTVYRLRWIPPGTFMMGSPDKERDRGEDEQLHEVTLSEGYWLGETAVTQALWEAVTGKNPSVKSKEGRLPVNSVSWDDCSVFITSLQESLPSFKACMPTEAQWEHACRAGTRTPYWWGDDFSPENGNNNNDKGIERETRYTANGFGLKSMHGNVWEWCQDWYSEYPTGPVMDPKGPTDGQFRVLRGGSRISLPQHLRAARRDHSTPDYRNLGSGLRLAGGCDPQAGSGRGAARSADRDEGTEEQRGALGRLSAGKDA